LQWATDISPPLLRQPQHYPQSTISNKIHLPSITMAAPQRDNVSESSFDMVDDSLSNTTESWATVSAVPSDDEDLAVVSSGEEPSTMPEDIEMSEDRISETNFMAPSAFAFQSSDVTLPNIVEPAYYYEEMATVETVPSQIPSCTILALRPRTNYESKSSFAAHDHQDEPSASSGIANSNSIELPVPAWYRHFPLVNVASNGATIQSAKVMKVHNSEPDIIIAGIPDVPLRVFVQAYDTEQDPEMKDSWGQVVLKAIKTQEQASNDALLQMILNAIYEQSVALKNSEHSTEADVATGEILQSFCTFDALVSLVTKHWIPRNLKRFAASDGV
jgi:hypothetical protein